MKFFGFSTKWLILLGVALAGGVAALMWSPDRRQHPAPIVEQPAAPSQAEMMLAGIEFTEIEQEQKRWTLRAAEARYFQNEQKTELKEVNLIFYLNTGEEIQLHSQRGILYAGSKNVELMDGVQATIAQAYRLQTPYAFYDHQRKIISGTAIHADGPELLLDGKRWEYSIPEQRASIREGVNAALSFAPQFEAQTKK
jgi:LPS export ABC transporter protein LptC